jgi:hypothetical protein
MRQQKKGMFKSEFSCDEETGCKATGINESQYCKCIIGHILKYYSENCNSIHKINGEKIICNQKNKHDGWHYNSNKNIAWENK